MRPPSEREHKHNYDDPDGPLFPEKQSTHGCLWALGYAVVALLFGTAVSYAAGLFGGLCRCGLNCVCSK
jgi:hypothetical protein